MNGDIYNGDWYQGKMDGKGGYYYSFENYFYKGSFLNGELTGKGALFYCDTLDFYLGEVVKGKYHGKGLFYRHENQSWEFSLYNEGRVINTIEAGEGMP